MANLFQPLKIRSVSFKNRIAVSPMCMYSSVDGFANNWHLVHLGSRAVGGAAIVFTEATAVSPEGRITHQDLGLWKDEHIDYLKKITDFISQQGAEPGVQLAHAGRKASHHRPWEGAAALGPGEAPWPTLGPSAVPYKAGEPLPLEMSVPDIQKLMDDFIAATERAKEAGFRVIEIHGAHGYLFHEFYSPLSNFRKDLYGGSFENRIRLLVQISGAVRKAWPEELPLFVRISASDWAEGGWSLDDSIRLARVLKETGVDLIDCSSGGNAQGQKINTGPLYQVPFAETIKKETGILTGAVGLITSAQQAEDIISSGKGDLVFLARQFLRDPYFPLHAAKELGVDIAWPNQYLRGKQ